MNDSSTQTPGAGRFARALMIATAALVVAGGSMLLGLSVVGWASPLLVAAVGAGLLWYLLEREARRRRAEIGRIARRVSRLGAPLIEEMERPPPPTLEAVTGALDARDAAIGGAIDEVRRRHGAARAVIDALEQPVIATGADGRVVVCNEAAGAVIGASIERAVGASFEDLIAHTELLDMHARARAGERVRRRLRLPLEAGVAWFDVSMAPFGDPGQGATRAVAITLQDVTELATAVQLKTDFAANASHELRTPIAAIRAAIETMSGVDERDTAMRTRLRTMIETNVSRLEEMVSDLLDLSKLESPDLATRRVPVDLEELGERLREVFTQRCAERDLDLAFEIEPGARTLACDPNLLELILRNLIDNATRFAFEGTRVRVVAEGLGETGARLRVIDRGEGIPLKHQQRIFERFYQVDEARSGGMKKRGTGLGLAIVKHAARRLGGTVAVESVWQQGTTMIVDLPGVRESQGEAGSP